MNGTTLMLAYWAPRSIVSALTGLAALGVVTAVDPSAPAPETLPAAEPMVEAMTPVVVEDTRPLASRPTAKPAPRVVALADTTDVADVTVAVAEEPVQMASAVAPAGDVVRAVQAGVVATSAKNEEVNVPVGHSTVIKAPWNVARVSIANPDVADVEPITPTQVLVVGKEVGSTDLTIWNEQEQTWQARVFVEVDLVKMGKDLSRFLPGSQIELTQTEDVIVVTGLLRQAGQAAALHRFFESADVKYVDMTSLAGVQQVQIQVRVAEASRTAIRALGVNWLTGQNDFFGAGTIGDNPNGINIGVPEGAAASSNLPFSFNTETAVSSASTLLLGFPSIDLQVFLEALKENQYIRVLAEPTLVALTGEEASFLAGGEFPVPIVQGTSVGAGSTITVEYKEFGVRLRFRPTVLGDGSIRLHVAPEVSDLSDIGAVQLEGFRIPSLITRRAETTIEMNSGQTFAMAGLIDRNVTARTQKVPGLGDMPVIGALFRSVRYEKGETELLVLATVSLVEPMNHVGPLPVPGDAHRTPSDWEFYAQAKIQGETPAKLSPVDAEWIEKLGLNRLKGPGAWTTYDDKAVPTVIRRTIAPRPAAWFDETDETVASNE